MTALIFDQYKSGSSTPPSFLHVLTGTQFPIGDPDFGYHKEHKVNGSQIEVPEFQKKRVGGGYWRCRVCTLRFSCRSGKYWPRHFYYFITWYSVNGTPLLWLRSSTDTTSPNTYMSRRTALVLAAIGSGNAYVLNPVNVGRRGPAIQMAEVGPPQY